MLPESRRGLLSRNLQKKQFGVIPMSEVSELAEKVRRHSPKFEESDSSEDVITSLLQAELVETAELEQKRREVRQNAGLEVGEAELAELVESESDVSEDVRQKQEELRQQRR